MATSITIRPLTSEDRNLAPEALELLNRTQGRGLFNADFLSSRLENPESFVVAAFEQNRLVGIGIAEIIKNFDYYLPFDSNIAHELELKKVASFATLSVSEPLQGKGIGQALSAKRMDWAKDRKCDVVIGVSWISGLPHTSDRTFEKAGFRAVKKLDDFYRQSSIEKPFDCPGCRNIPCLCGAILYRMDLSEEGHAGP